MPSIKLEYSHNLTDSKIWIINLSDKIITIKFGKKNGPLQEKTLKFPSTTKAKDEYNKRIEGKKKKGYVNMTSGTVNSVNNKPSKKSLKKSSSKPLFIMNEFMKIIFKVINEYVGFNEKANNKAYQIIKENRLEGDAEQDIFDKMESILDQFHEARVKTLNNYHIKFQNKKLSPFIHSNVITKTIPSSLTTSITSLIENYSKTIPTDYHPGSNNKIIDIVHPSLYPLIHKSISSYKNLEDYWGRPYESSKFQWLPSEFNIDSEGKCKIESYINNLPVTQKALYGKIEELFEFVLPQFEDIWTQVNKTKLFTDEALYAIKKKGKSKQSEQITLKNRTLQVITKIVKINFDKKDILEGAWHVEGMSHENIVLTASCTLKQDTNIESVLKFKRRYTQDEGEMIRMETHQNQHRGLEEFLNLGVIPLGKINTKERTMIAFPNSHIHRIDMSSSKPNQSRLLLVFWLINPEKRITSTKDISQQNYSIKLAKENRLELMKERTFHKNSFNIRDLNLCEH